MRNQGIKNWFSSSFRRMELLKTSFFLGLIFTIGSLLIIYHNAQNYEYFSNYVSRHQTESAANGVLNYFYSCERFAQYLSDSTDVQNFIKEANSIETNYQIAESQFSERVRYEMESVKKQLPDMVSNVFLATTKGKQAIDFLGNIYSLESQFEKKPWYKVLQSTEKGKFYLTESYEDQLTGNQVITLVVPVLFSGKLSGIIGLDISMNVLENTLKKIHIGETGYVIVVDTYGKVVWHPDEEYIGSVALDYMKMNTKRLSEKYTYSTNITFEIGKEQCHGAIKYEPKLGYLFVGVLPNLEFFNQIKNEAESLAFVIGLCIVLFLFEFLLNINQIVKPIQRIEKISTAIAAGQLDVCTVSTRKDELGRLENTLKYLADGLHKQELKLDVERQIVESVQIISALYDTPDKVAEQLVQKMIEIFQADRAYIFEINTKNFWENTYEAVSKGIVSKKDNMQDIPYEKLSSWVQIFQEHKYFIPKNIMDLKEEEPWIYEQLNMQNICSIAIIPLYIQNTLIGFWGMDNPKIPQFIQYTDEMIMAGSFISNTLRQRDLIKKIEKISYFDELTKLGNRHALSAYLESMDLSSCMGVCFADITGLKAVNDTEGHAAGDELIVRAANVMLSVYASYKIFRYGGDELLVLCSKIGQEEMEKTVEQVKQRAEKFHVTFAVGISWATDSNSVEKQIAEAEKAMYEDKRIYYEKSGIERRRR